MDLVKKLLHNVSCAYPISYQPSEVSGNKKELEKLVGFGILQRKIAVTFQCQSCGTHNEIKKLANGRRVILCQTCEQARLYTLDDNDGHEYAVSLNDLLKHLLTALDFPSNDPKPMFQDRLWSLGTQEVNGTPREILYLREPEDAEMEIFAHLEQKKALHPIVFSTISQDRLLNTKLTLIPLENLLVPKGENLFSRELLDKILGEGGNTMSCEAIDLGDSGIVLDTAAILYGQNASGNYKSEQLEPLERNMIENFYRRGMADKNKWHARDGLAVLFGVTPASFSNAMTRIRKIGRKIGMAIIEQNTRTKWYRINPDLLPRQFTK